MARSQVSGLGGDSLTQRAAELLDRRERAGRLGSGLARIVRDLADARRQIAALKHENASLRAQLASAASASRREPREPPLAAVVAAPPDERG